MAEAEAREIEAGRRKAQAMLQRWYERDTVLVQDTEEEEE